MSTIQITPAVPPPFSPALLAESLLGSLPVVTSTPDVDPPRPLAQDAATQAAVKYLTTGSLDAFDHLVAICYRSIGNLFLKDDFGDYVVRGVQHDELTGRPNGYNRRREGTDYRTHLWIQEWVLERLYVYHDTSAVVVQEAAGRGEFRYIGRRCRLALIDTLRKLRRYQVDGSAPRIVRISEPVDAGSARTFGASFQTWNIGWQSSLARLAVSLDDLTKLVAEYGSDLIDVHPELMAYLDNAFGGEKSVTAAIAETRNVSERQARTYKKTFLDLARQGDNPALRELYRRLQLPPTFFLDRASKGTRANRLLRSEALDDMLGFHRWCQESQLAANDPTCELRDLAKARETWC